METSTDESNIVKNRQMGYLSCTSFVVGNIIGSGIFITPGVIYAYVNSVGLSFIVWILCAAVSLLGALVYVELGTGILESGCDYSYICYVKWIPPGFAFMFVGALLSFPASNAVQATTFSRYLIEGISPLYIVPSPYDIICERLIATAVLVFLVWLNFHSLGGFVAKFQIVATVAKLLSLALVILGGLYYLIFKGMTQHLENPFDGSKWNVSDLMLGMYAGLWTLAGWDVLNYGAPEIRNPKRNMPLALISGIFTVTAIYILVNLAFFVVLDSQSLKDSNAIAARFSQQAFGDFSFIVPFLIVILLVGTMNGLMFCSSRYMYAAAKRGHLPAYLTCINERTGSPRAAVFTQAILCEIFVFFDVQMLIQYASFVLLFQRIFTMFALFWIRYKKIPVHPDTVHMPIMLAIIFFTVSIALTVIPVVVNFKVTVIGLAFVLCGVVFYYALVRPKTTPRLLHDLNERTCRIAMRILDCKADLPANIANDGGQ